MFHYKGPATITDGERSVHLSHLILDEEVRVEEWTNADGHVQETPGRHWWHGHSRTVGAPRGLLDLMGGEAVVVLPGGRTGRALLTGYCQDSCWVIEIQGVGPIPR